MLFSELFSKTSLRVFQLQECVSGEADGSLPLLFCGMSACGGRGNPFRSLNHSVDVAE